jgi:hypothetical protein
MKYSSFFSECLAIQFGYLNEFHSAVVWTTKQVNNFMLIEFQISINEHMWQIIESSLIHSWPQVVFNELESAEGSFTCGGTGMVENIRSKATMDGYVPNSDAMHYASITMHNCE